MNLSCEYIQRIPSGLWNMFVIHFFIKLASTEIQDCHTLMIDVL